MKLPERFHPLSIGLHWLMFLLFVVALAAIEVRGDIPKGDPLRDTLRSVHMLAGQLILLLAVIRVGARLGFAAPAELPAPKWQNSAAKLVHLVLYALMFALPVCGILMMQNAGREVSFFGLVLPALIEPHAEWKKPLHEAHELMGNAVYFIVGAHVLAALWHQLVMKDHLLLRMMPGKR